MPTTTKPSTRKKPAEDMTIPNRNNRFLSILSLIAPFIMLPVVGIVAGHVALKEYSKENSDQTWKPIALAGTISGYVVLFVKINIIMIVGAFLSTQASYPHHGYMNQYDMPMYEVSQQNTGMMDNNPMEEYVMGGDNSNSMMGEGSAYIAEDGTVTFVDGIQMPSESLLQSK